MRPRKVDQVLSNPLLASEITQWEGYSRARASLQADITQCQGLIRKQKTEEQLQAEIDGIKGILTQLKAQMATIPLQDLLSNIKTSSIHRAKLEAELKEVEARTKSNPLSKASSPASSASSPGDTKKAASSNKRDISSFHQIGRFGDLIEDDDLIADDTREDIEEEDAKLDHLAAAVKPAYDKVATTVSQLKSFPSSRSKEHIQTQINQHEIMLQELIDKRAELLPRLQNWNFMIDKLQLDMRELDTKNRELSEKSLLKKLATDPKKLYEKLVERVTSEFDAYDAEHPANQSTQIRMCLASFKDKILKSLSPEPQPDAFKNREEHEYAVKQNARLNYYLLCGLLWDLLEGIDNGNEKNDLFGNRILLMLRKDPIDRNYVREKYKALKLPVKDAQTFSKEEQASFYRIAGDANALLAKLSERRKETFLSSAQGLITDIAEKEERGTDSFDYKFYIALSMAIQAVLEAPDDVTRIRRLAQLTKHVPIVDAAGKRLSFFACCGERTFHEKLRDFSNIAGGLKVKSAVVTKKKVKGGKELGERLLENEERSEVMMVERSSQSAARPSKG